ERAALMTSNRKRCREKAQAQREPPVSPAVAVAIRSVELDTFGGQPMAHAKLIKGLASILTIGLGRQTHSLSQLQFGAQAPGHSVLPLSSIEQPTEVGMNQQVIIA